MATVPMQMLAKMRWTMANAATKDSVLKRVVSKKKRRQKKLIREQTDAGKLE